MRANKLTKKEEVFLLFKQGKSPKEISQIIKLSFKQVMNYLFVQVGEGEIRRSDIWFSINHNIREAIEEYQWAQDNKLKEEEERASEKLLDIICEHDDEYFLYAKLKGARVYHGDMYELISGVELLIHRAIKNVLIKNYGPTELEWWRIGVPKDVRIECAKRYEEDDDDPAKEPFCYTNFIDLKKIFEKQWSLFEKILPKDIVKDKKGFLNKLIIVNKIRNRVMHPIKGHDFTPEDFEFVHEFHAAIGIDKWQDKEITK
jgi:hypothetical protein